MSDLLSAITQSLGADIRQLNTISHNVANSATPGFRAERTLPSFADALGAAPPNTVPRPAVSSEAVSIDQRDGSLVQTGRHLDLALRGPGFFNVRRDGAEALVRAGNFRVDVEGRLVTPAGEPVLGVGGSELMVGNAPFRVAADGAMTRGDEVLGQLWITQAADPAQLMADRGAFRYAGAAADWTGTLVQGAIEQSNVDSAEEAVRLMELTRHLESVQRAASIYDRALETGINKIGEN